MEAFPASPELYSKMGSWAPASKLYLFIYSNLKKQTKKKQKNPPICKDLCGLTIN